MLNVHVMGERGLNGLHDVAYIRLLKPLYLLELDGEIRLTASSDYKGYEQSDVFIVQRQWNIGMAMDKAEDFIKYLKKSGKKFIYELDDNLLDNECICANTKNIIRNLIINADLVTVSTEELANRLQSLNNKISIVPNYLSEAYIRNDNIKKNSLPIVSIGYMGTYTHQNDLMMIKLPLTRLLNKYKNTVRLEILGITSDQSIFSECTNVIYHDITDHSSYEKFWLYMKENVFWDIGLAPLVLDDFTRCKSDIKFLDYTALNICGIYSDHPAYNKTVSNQVNGIICKYSVDEWYYNLESLIRDKQKRDGIVQKARNTLLETRILENNYNCWLSLLRKVLE